ncbi:hypothetical protein BON30_42620 [Cystobacter ferrugineus]|uniref:AAA+ ATPase domain-containing protein n=2 Tax=Cystobacter ferrugineus TaxID=83449 RepID=A0A1L9AWX1_9BACT|nr:hypothetical protein BON30_42620 [Cystobacter ferrugineus]
MALLGAECTALVREDVVIDAHQGYPDQREAWDSLGERMRAHVAGEGASRLLGVVGLPEASYWLVQLCTAVEVYPEAAAAVSIIAEDERLSLVTPVVFARLLRAALGIPFAQALREAIPGGTAERLGLVERAEPAANRPLSQQPLRLTAAELAAALGDEPASDKGTLSVRREPPSAGTGFARAFVQGAAELLRERGVLCIRAASSRAGRQLALDLASYRGESALLVTAGEELVEPAEVWRLRGGLAIVDLSLAAGARGFSEAWVQRLARHQRPLVVIAPWSTVTFELATVDVEGLDPQARLRVWSLGLGDESRAAGLASRFGVNLEEVRAAVRAARDTARLEGRMEVEGDEQTLAAEVMAQGARRMGRVVSRLRTNARIEHLIVPPAMRQALEDIVAWYRAGPRVRGEWHLAERSPLGRGLSCLFAGPPGTGKTFAAQCLAGTLGLNLYRIDLSQVVSKYIGETEKALHRIFEEAESGHGILLFDEADALFGKRSEVKDAHDRYANIEVGYLLQRLESFEGVSILTTNLRNHIDPAFVRRLAFILDFPMPDARTRRTLWEQSLPPRERWEPSLDLGQFVERFPLSGGNIHNIGLAAAHLAAARADGSLRTEHLVRATYRELEKNGMPRSRESFGPLSTHLPGR